MKDFRRHDVLPFSADSYRLIKAGASTVCTAALAMFLGAGLPFAAHAQADCANPPGGYEGFGRNTTGGDTTIPRDPPIQVYRVRNLNDSGPESLRDAVSQGNRCVVFEVGGTISLTSFLIVRGANITIDGFTAPAPGITLTRWGFDWDGPVRGVSNIIARGIRIRDTDTPESLGADGFQIVGVKDFVIDHVSVARWGDGSLDIAGDDSLGLNELGDSRDGTIQWSIIGGRQVPTNEDKSLLVKYGARRISLHHNLLISAHDRSPYCAWTEQQDVALKKPGSGCAAGSPCELVCDIRNNLVWGHGWSGTSVRDNGTANVVNNYYFSSVFPAADAALYVEDDAIMETAAYASGNFSPALPNGAIDAMGNRATPFPAEPVTTTDAVTAANQVVAQAGAKGPNFGRDATDECYINQITLGPSPTTSTFSKLDPCLGNGLNSWEPLTPSRWSVVSDGGDLRYGINTTDFLELPTSRLGEYSLVKGRTYGNFFFSARARSTENFTANNAADYDVVFGFQDANNYYYAMISRWPANTQLFKVVNGVRQPALATANFAIPDNNYHLVTVARIGSSITVSFDGAIIMQANDATFGAGSIGIGGYDDAAWWDDIAIYTRDQSAAIYSAPIPLLAEWATYGSETGTFSGGTIVASSHANDTATFTFTGTAVKWIGVRCDVCGKATVSIDGGAPIEVNTATGISTPQGSLVSEPVFSASGLASGVTHTMVITVTGTTTSGGTHVAVDAFDVTP